MNGDILGGMFLCPEILLGIQKAKSFMHSKASNASFRSTTLEMTMIQYMPFTLWGREANILGGLPMF